MPSIPGIRMSVSTQPTSMPGSSFRKLCAESKSRTLNPAEPSRKSSESRIAESSSMTQTLPLCAMTQILGRCCRQAEAKRRAARVVCLGPHPAAVSFDDGTADREADAHAILFRCEERLKQVRVNLSAKPVSGIRYCDFDHVVCGPCVRSDQLAAGRALIASSALRNRL